MSYFVIVVSYIYVHVSFSGLITSVGEERSNCSAIAYCTLSIPKAGETAETPVKRYFNTGKYKENIWSTE